MARLKGQLRTAQDRQTASAEILRTIGSVSGDAERSLHEIAETTKRLFEASSVSIFVAEGDKWGQIIHDGASSKRISAEVPVDQLRIGGHSLPGAAFSENRQIHLPDIDDVDPAIADWPGLRPARAAGTRTLSGTPLRRAGHAIGVLIVHRNRLAPFSEDELNLLQIFADQAAIAIHNARLFNEVQAKTADLQESLQQQTATADVLKVISRSAFELEPALVAVCETAARLCDADQAAIFQREGELYRFAACFGFPPEYENAWRAAGLIRNDPKSPLPGHRAVAERRPVHILDVTADPAYLATTSGQSQARTALGIRCCGMESRSETSCSRAGGSRPSAIDSSSSSRPLPTRQ